MSVVSLNRLSQELFLSGRGEHFGEDSLAFGDVAFSESSKTELHDGSVVENLRRDIGLRDSVLKMRHEEKISSLVVSTVGSVVENVRQDGSSTEEWGVRVIDVDTEIVNKRTGVPWGIEGSDGGFQASDSGCHSLLKVVDDDVWLKMSTRPSTINRLTLA